MLFIGFNLKIMATPETKKEKQLLVLKSCNCRQFHCWIGIVLATANKYGFLFFPLSSTNIYRIMERERGALDL